MDVISLEVLRYRFEAVCDAGGRAIERTAISPIVAETKDYSCTLTDADGTLVQGGGAIRHHFYSVCNGVRATLRLHRDTIREGDIFCVNDPHNGGGLHAQDVLVLKPILVDGVLIAWIGCSAHMSDMGGMVPGSWAPDATECYQEALRFPPVRIASAGIECSDIWAIIRTNIRMAEVIEMDMRALIAGVNVAAADLRKTIAQLGVESFLTGITELHVRVLEEVRRRITTLTDGVYVANTWLEWGKETFSVPCRMTVKGDRLTFDYEGASPQCRRFFNSHTYIVVSELATELSSFLAHDLPYNGGFIEAFEVRCPPRSILDSEPPAPIAAGHMEVGMTAAEIGIQAYMLALAASPQSPLCNFLTAAPVSSAYLFQTWSGLDAEARNVGWLTIEGASNGGAGGPRGNGNDLGIMSVGGRHGVETPDVEVMESWYPVRYEYKRPAIGATGSGRFRSGGSYDVAYRKVEGAQLTGSNLGNRQHIPFPGLAGGYPGRCSDSWIMRADGTRQPLDNHDTNFVLNDGDLFCVCPGSGGGWGDPINRDPASVEEDVRDGRINAGVASEIYGVVPGDIEATKRLRTDMLADRLKRARPASKSIADDRFDREDRRGPLYFGVEQHGDFAVSSESGAVLAKAPDHWTDGCPTLADILTTGSGVSIRAYLDPLTGKILATDVAIDGVERSFTSMPDRWVRSTSQLGADPQSVAAE